MRGAIDTIGDALDDQTKLQKEAHNESTHEQGNDSCDEIDQSLCRRLLHAEDDAGDYHDSAGENGDDVQQFYEAAKQRMIKREIEKSRKEILFIGHASPWAPKSIVEAGVLRLVRLFRGGSQGK